VLVATDIAARGIHVDGIDLVIHADAPADHKAYLHRSGRTARAGASGVVVTLQTRAQAGEVRALMSKAGVVPLVADVNSGSALLRQIAGAPARPAAATAAQPFPATELSLAGTVADPAAPAARGYGSGAVAMSAGFRRRR
jgi:ERCC4-related helicase